MHILGSFLSPGEDFYHSNIRTGERKEGEGFSHRMTSMCPFLAARWRGETPLGSEGFGSNMAAHMLLLSRSWTTCNQRRSQVNDNKHADTPKSPSSRLVGAVGVFNVGWKVKLNLQILEWNNCLEQRGTARDSLDVIFKLDFNFMSFNHPATERKIMSLPPTHTHKLTHTQFCFSHSLLYGDKNTCLNT